MSKQPLIDFFQKNSDMSLQTIINLTTHFEDRRFLKNEFFLREGKVSDHLYLAEGLMRAYTFDLKAMQYVPILLLTHFRVFKLLLKNKALRPS